MGRLWKLERGDTTTAGRGSEIEVEKRTINTDLLGWYATHAI